MGLSVYVVTRGAYSDYIIMGVYGTQAEAITHIESDSLGDRWDYHIELWEGDCLNKILQLDKEGKLVTEKEARYLCHLESLNHHLEKDKKLLKEKEDQLNQKYLQEKKQLEEEKK